MKERKKTAPLNSKLSLEEVQGKVAVSLITPTKRIVLSVTVGHWTLVSIVELTILFVLRRRSVYPESAATDWRSSRSLADQVGSGGGPRPDPAST
jgi:hypothetical protein